MSDSSHSSRLSVQDFKALIAERIVVFDGAMGTQVLALDLQAADFGGEQFEGCNEYLALTRPEIITEIHTGFLEAGADFIETDTFGATAIVLAEFGLEGRVLEINRAAARLAREAAARFSTPERTRFVAGSMGPTTKTISVTGGITFDEMAEAYELQAQGLLEGGVDILIIETCQDTLNVKAALIGTRRAMARLGVEPPIMISATIEPMGTMLAGQSAEALHAALEHAGLVSLGLNCATGPEPMLDHIRALSELSPGAISCMPNAGLPDEDGLYHETPESLSMKLARFCEQGLINLVGSCCGSTPAHTRAIADMARSFKPRQPRTAIIPAISGIDYLDLEQTRPVIVGERTNVIGSRLFKRLITEEKFEEASEVGRRQVRGGAHMIDVCMANPDRDEVEDIIRFLEHLTRKVRVPLMIDSTSDEVIEEALKRCQGKSVINSINLEDGEERFQQVCPLVHRYGAAVVVGCIDEDPDQGMGVTRRRKLEIAVRSFDLLTTKYGIPARDIIFDALVFPCGTGDAQYIGSARETIEGVRMIKERLPECRTILGISNVSFGLPDSGREALNTIFMHKNFEAGLDMAIVNSQRLERVTQLPPEEIALCEALIDAAEPTEAEKALTGFVAYFKKKAGKAMKKIDRSGMPLGERLATCVIEGSKEGLLEDLDEALGEQEPLGIINGPLMDGMAEVGRLFGSNQLIVAEVLQSAEVMKAAVAHLEPHMKHLEESIKGKLLLATVKGDVHDIGKNLVDIILSNNGFKVVNLGIKVAPQQLIEATREHNPDFIGLSGLLVKSAQQMIATAKDLRAQQISIPILVGGAALTERFTYGRIAPEYDGLVAYAADAMTGLAFANRLADEGEREALKIWIEEKKAEAVKVKPKKDVAPPAVEVKPVEIAAVTPPGPPDLDLHVLDDVALETVWPYVNPSMLYTRHLGLKGRLEDLLEKGDRKAVDLHKVVTELQDEILARKLLRARAVYRFYQVASDGDGLIVYDSGGAELCRFEFPRQRNGQRRCLSDLVASRASGTRDYIAVLVTSCQGQGGNNVRILADEWKDAGDYLRSHSLQALALETAEATAEWLHQRIRAMWGFSDPPSISMKDLFRAEYSGKRFSFGYPACPRLEDQALLWPLLDPSDNIGVALTEGYMMDPEASVSALVFHHPQAEYFSVGEQDAE